MPYPCGTTPTLNDAANMCHNWLSGYIRFLGEDPEKKLYMVKFWHRDVASTIKDQTVWRCRLRDAWIMAKDMDTAGRVPRNLRICEKNVAKTNEGTLVRRK